MPETVVGVHSELGFRRSVQSMFGEAASQAIANHVLGAVSPATEGDAPFTAPLMLATALRSVGVETVDDARAILIASTRGKHMLRTLDVDAQGQVRKLNVPMNRAEHFKPEHESALFALERVLASTVAGTQALKQLRHLEQAPAELAVLRDQLLLCSALQDKGVALEAHSSPESVLQHLEMRSDTKMGDAVGKDDDAPLQLLAKALRHAQTMAHDLSGPQHDGVPPARTTAAGAGSTQPYEPPLPRPDDQPAYVAREQGGFIAPQTSPADSLQSDRSETWQLRGFLGSRLNELVDVQVGVRGGGTTVSTPPLLDTKMEAAVGKDDDERRPLLARALRDAQTKSHDVSGAQDHGLLPTRTTVPGVGSTQPNEPPMPRPDDYAAYVAWKQGGFVESGKGTDFNRTIERLHKFLTYVERADHGPRTAGNIARDARAWSGRVLGIGKSPLTASRYGPLGADRGLLVQEVAKYNDGLSRTLGAAVENLVDELRDPATQTNPAQRNKRLAQAALLDLWRATGRTRFAVGEVHQRANELLAQVNPQVGEVTVNALMPHLRRVSRRCRDDSGAAALQVGIRTLEAAGAAQRRRTAAAQTPGVAADPDSLTEQIRELRASPFKAPDFRERLAELQLQRRQMITAMVQDLQSTRDARVEENPLFRFSDLKALFRGAPRQGPTAEDAHRILSSIARAPYESSSTLTSGTSRGLGTVGALLLDIAAWTGTPLAYPIVQVQFGTQAQVSLGTTITGSRFYVGKESSRSILVGAGAGWAAPPVLGNKVRLAVLADASIQRGGSHGEGAVITARNDQPGWQEKLPQVVDFMFEQAKMPKGDGEGHRAKDGAQFWQRYCDRFGDDAILAVGWNSERSTSTAVQIGATGIARVAVSPVTSIGPALSVGLSAQASRFERMPRTDGVDVPVAVHQRAVTVAGSAALSQTLPAALPGDSTQESGGVAGWGSAVAYVSGTLEMAVAGSAGVARLGRNRDGQLSPSLCHRQVQFHRPDRLIQYANLHRDKWEAALVANDPDCAAPGAARARLDEFLDQISRMPYDDGALHGEQRALARPVADRINLLEARLATLVGHGDSGARARALSAPERAECRAIESEVQRLLHAEASWEPVSMYAVEFNNQGNSRGLRHGVRAVVQEQASAVRLTALFVAGLPQL